MGSHRRQHYHGRHTKTPHLVRVAATATGVAAAGTVAVAVVTTPVSAAPAHVTAPVTTTEEVQPAAPVTTQAAPPAQASADFTVAPGDTLSGLAARYCGSAVKWPGLYYANKALIPDPDMLQAGLVLKKACTDAPPPPPPPAPPAPPRVTTAYVPAGDLSCASLETLWVSAGGRQSSALMAAEIAMAESGGQLGATHYDANGTVDRGLWQINSSNGGLSTYSAAGNALAAVKLSGNGTDWSAWATYSEGTYSGKC